MELTTEERQKLIDEIVEQQKAENKASLEKIEKGIRDTAAEKKALQERIDELETKMGRPLLEGMPGTEKKAEIDHLPLVFVDDKGIEHKALRLGENLFKGKPEDFSVGKILAAKITGNVKGLNEYETKAISEGIGSAGGFLLSEQVSARVIDMARNLMCVVKAGAGTIGMTTPELRLVKITGDPTAMFRAESGAITESQWSLEPINLRAMSVGVLCRASREILSDAANAGTALQQAMAQAIALAVDRVGLTGNGVSEPRGIDKCSGINIISMGVNGLALSNFDEFSEAVEDICDNNGIEPFAVIYSPRTHFALDRLKAATTNQPMIPPQSFQDLKKFKTNQILNTDTQGTATTASKAFVGDYKNLLIGIRQNVEVEMTTVGGTGVFAQHEALIKAVMRMDIAVLRENHFTKIEGIIP